LLHSYLDAFFLSLLIYDTCMLERTSSDRSKGCFYGIPTILRLAYRAYLYSHLFFPLFLRLFVLDLAFLVLTIPTLVSKQSFIFEKLAFITY
jgi:hypothetical protein